MRLFEHRGGGGRARREDGEREKKGRTKNRLDIGKCFCGSEGATGTHHAREKPLAERYPSSLPQTFFQPHRFSLLPLSILLQLTEWQRAHPAAAPEAIATAAAAAPAATATTSSSSINQHRPSSLSVAARPNCFDRVGSCGAPPRIASRNLASRAPRFSPSSSVVLTEEYIRFSGSGRRAGRARTNRDVRGRASEPGPGVARSEQCARKGCLGLPGTPPVQPPR